MIASRRTFTGQQVGTSAMRIAAFQSYARDEPIIEHNDDKQASNRAVGPAPPSQLTASSSASLLRLFARILSLTSRDDCTDPRDRVFAVLMLIKHAADARNVPSLPLQVDYSKNVATVFAETTGWLIETSGWLGMLLLIHSRRTLECLPLGMPSWVPDFHSTTTFGTPKTLLTFNPVID